MESQVEKIKLFVSENEYKTIALQFPIDSLKNGVEIYKKLRDSFPFIHFYMLADQTYSSCCVDEITAKHVPPDLIIHFGDACLSITSHQYKVLYAFVESPLNVGKLKCALSKLDSSDPITLIYDTSFVYLKEQLSCMNLTTAHDIYVGHPVKPINSEFLNCVNATTCENPVFGRYFVDAKLLTRTIVVVSYSNDNKFCQIIRNNFNNQKVYVYDSSKDVLVECLKNDSKVLGKRVNAIQKATASHNIGILINLPSLINYQQVVEKLKLIIKKSGRKYYIVSIGRISPPKLANFASIQSWVLISCYYNAIIDNKDFYQPIITPMECYIACVQPSTYKYSTNLQDFIDLKVDTMDFVDIDLVLQENSKEWKGLEFKNSEPFSTKMIQGQNGIAESYNTERIVD